MSTYSVYNIKIDNNLSFTPGATAGYVLAIDSNGSTYWAAGGAGGSGTSGTSGSSGSSGTSGVSGSTGSSGSSGTSGVGLGLSAKSGIILNDNPNWVELADYGSTGKLFGMYLTFSQAFSSSNYTIGLNADTDAISSNQSGSGFSVSLRANYLQPKPDLYWSAIANGETAVPGTSGTSGTSGIGLGLSSKSGIHTGTASWYVINDTWGGLYANYRYNVIFDEPFASDNGYTPALFAASGFAIVGATAGGILVGSNYANVPNDGTVIKWSAIAHGETAVPGTSGTSGVNGATGPAGSSTGSFGITIDGGGSAITTGLKGYVQVPYSGTITGWTLLSDISGSIVIDVWKDTFATFPPSVADTIAGSEKPTLSSAQKSGDNSLSTWTTSVSAGDIIGFNVDSASTLTRVNLAINITKS